MIATLQFDTWALLAALAAGGWAFLLLTIFSGTKKKK